MFGVTVPYGDDVCNTVEENFRPMSHLQFYHAILSRNFIARQNRSKTLLR